MACVDRPARPRAAWVGDTAGSTGAAALAATRRKPACEGDGAAIPTTLPRRCYEPSLGDSAACCASTAMLLNACVRALGPLSACLSAVHAARQGVRCDPRTAPLIEPKHCLCGPVVSSCGEYGRRQHERRVRSLSQTVICLLCSCGGQVARAATSPAALLVPVAVSVRMARWVCGIGLASFSHLRAKEFFWHKVH